MFGFSAFAAPPSPPRKPPPPDPPNTEAGWAPGAAAPPNTDAPSEAGVEPNAGVPEEAAGAEPNTDPLELDIWDDPNPETSVVVGVADPKTDPPDADPKTEVPAPATAEVAPKTDPLAVVAKGADPKTDPLEDVEAGVDPKTDPLAVVGAGIDPKTDPLAVVEVGVDPKTDPVAVVEAGVDPNTDPLAVVEAGVDPKTDPVAVVAVGVDPKTDPLAVVEAGVDPKTDPVAVVALGVDPKTDPLAVVEAGVDPKTDPLAVVEAGADPKTDEDADAGVFPNTEGDPLEPPKAEAPPLCPPKTDPAACWGFDPKTELADVVVTALEDPNTEVDVDPPNADTVEAGAVEDDPNTDPEDEGAAEDDPKTDPAETDGAEVDEPPVTEDEVPPKIPPGLEADPPNAVLLGGAPPKTLEPPEPPNTEPEEVVVVEGVLEETPADDGDSVFVTFSDPGAVAGTLPPKIPPELADAPPPNAVLLGAAPPKTGLISVTEEGTIEAAVFFTVTEEAEEPKAGIAAAVMAFPVDEVVSATVVVIDLDPKLNTEDDGEAPKVFVNVVVLVSKSSLVAAGNFSPPEGAVDDKPKPSAGVAVVTAVVSVAVELWLTADFAKPNANPDFESPEPSGSFAVVEADM